MKAQNTLHGIARLIASLLVAGTLAGNALASDKTYVLPAAYKEECGSCHVAYPAPMLSADSWRAVMAGLERHFGSDASLEPEKATAITQYLVARASSRTRDTAGDTSGRPRLRITESEWFLREHRNGEHGLTAAVWTQPSVKSAANCAACHRGAETGHYAERDIVIPRP